MVTRSKNVYFDSKSPEDFFFDILVDSKDFSFHVVSKTENASLKITSFIGRDEKYKYVRFYYTFFIFQKLFKLIMRADD